MTYALALRDGDEVDLSQLPEEITSPHPPRSRAPLLRTLAEVEREHVLDVLDACGGRQADAARVLGIGRTTLWRKLRELGVTTAR